MKVNRICQAACLMPNAACSPRNSLCIHSVFLLQTKSSTEEFYWNSSRAMAQPITTAADRGVIIHLMENGYSISAAARETGRDRRTVALYGGGVTTRRATKTSTTAAATGARRLLKKTVESSSLQRKSSLWLLRKSKKHLVSNAPLTRSDGKHTRFCFVLYIQIDWRLALQIVCFNSLTPPVWWAI